jgi:hypothetical protein
MDPKTKRVRNQKMRGEKELFNIKESLNNAR